MDTPEPTLGRDRSLGDVLRDARQAKGLELGDISEITHVRKEYLEALEQERFDALPEDIYAKNFLKLFAQSVGLKEASVLELYARARGRRAATPSMTSPARKPQETPEEAVTDTPRRPRAPVGLSPWIPTVLLIAAVVALALWGFNNFLFSTGNQPVRDAAPLETAPVATPSEPTNGTTALESGTPAPVVGEDGTPTARPTEGESLSLLSLSSEPPGAEVVLDGFVLGPTPINEYAVSPLVNRSLRLTLEGYEPFETVVDLSQDQALSVVLRPLGGVAPEGAQEAAEAESPLTEVGEASQGGAGEAAQSGLGVTITAATWLEAYQSTARNVGERLVYRTVQPGDSFVFEFPVYLHVGNAGGVTLTRDGQDAGALGSSGEVISRAFSQ